MSDAAPATIPAVLRDAARRFGGHEAVVDDSVRLTFADLEARAEEAARAFIASGIAPGDRVAVWAPNSAAWIVASFGVYLAGAVLVPLNTRYKADEAAHVLRTSQAAIAVIVDEFLGTSYVDAIESVRAGLPLREVVVLSEWSRFAERAATVATGSVHERERAITPDDTSDVIFTSGTTGAPKGAMLAHGASVRTYETWADCVGLREGDRYSLVYPLFHTAGLKSGVLASVLKGATVFPEPVFDVPAVMKRVVDERITMLPGPPTVFQTILDDPALASFDLSSLRLSVTGAAVVPVEVIRRMREELRFENVVTGYGLTETTGTVSMCRHDDPSEVIAHTVGRPLPGVEVRIADDGEIQVRGFNVMKGYFDDPGATSAAIDGDGWLKTGDIGFVDGDGNLHITDRKKDMFIVGGFNAYPAEIEGTLLTHPDIAQVAVIGVPDERMGEVGCAFVIPKSGHAVDPDDVVAWSREKMANFKVPRRVVVVDALPLNPSGKVQKFKLRDSVSR